MPIYEYECGKCSERFEVLVRSKSDLKPSCPKCGDKKPAKVFSSFAVASASPSQYDGCPSAEAGACSKSECASGKCPFS